MIQISITFMVSLYEYQTAYFLLTSNRNRSCAHFRSVDDEDRFVGPTDTYIRIATLPLSSVIDVFPFLKNLPSFLKPWETRGRALFADNLKWAVEKKDVSSPSVLPVIVT